MNETLDFVGLVYAEFGEETGPVPKKYIPQHLDRELAIQIAVVSLTSSFMGYGVFEEPTEGFQVFPLLQQDKSVISHFFTLPIEGGTYIPATLNLIFEGGTSASFLSKCAKFTPKLTRISAKIKKAKEMEEEDYVDLHKTLTGKVPRKKMKVETPSVSFESLNDLLKVTMSFSPNIQSIAIISKKGELLESVFSESKAKETLKKVLHADFADPIQRIGKQINEEIDNLTVQFKQRRFFSASLKGGKSLVAMIRDSHGKGEELLIHLAARQLNREFL
ncbi:MAG: hypothetical protein GWO20_03300 [Candidatus Korarchaeota archaeon]|nr:hypothetical protein [Candidatus Korarchaeota archaeon]NIU81900.1 hypothetical protein [Candidatus Thorarchaeota archaeon]NIW12358.1 hypothetical protein [Candidatus Thorarchaeota archaeon]NIW51150.1 hypothetical protein [Candidatus Korarchaeota archaeon]